MRAAILAMVLGMVPVAFAADGPTIGAAPATRPVKPPVATAPADRPAASAPAGNSAEAVRDTLFSTTARGTVALPPSSVPSSQPANAGTLPPVGPKEPKVKTVMEGTLIFKQVGRLSRDEKSGQYIFSFDADGKAMRDPPMIVVPSKALAAMEKQSESGSKPVRFQVTGEVTEYNGKNYLLVHAVLVLRDINTGISGH